MGAATVPKPVEGHGKFGGYRIAFARSGGILDVALEYSMNTDRISKEEYPEFRKWLNELDRVLNQPIVITEAQ
jgi:hypothetical protein